MKYDSSLANAMHAAFSSDEPELQALLKLTAAQRSRWDYLLHLIDQAETSSLVARGAAMAAGYSLGLRDAGAITQSQCDQLAEQLKAHETENAHCVSPK